MGAYPLTKATDSLALASSFLLPHSAARLRNGCGEQITETTRLGIHPTTAGPSLKSAVFALGSFSRSEAVFGCLSGVLQTTVGYAGGSKTNPEYKSLGDHTEPVQVVYDDRLISYRQLLEVSGLVVMIIEKYLGKVLMWIIFTNGTEEFRLASVSKEREQTKSRSSIVTTHIQPLGPFYPAEPEHQKFELKLRPFLLQLMGNLPEEELERSHLAAKLN